MNKIITSRAGDAIVTLQEPIEHLQEFWERGQFFEQRLLEYIYWHYKGGTFVDVGSAIGNHSLFFALFCDPQCVVSIEPVLSSVERQREIYGLNHVAGKVHTHNVALSDVPGTGKMIPFANHNLGQFQLVPGDEVPVEILDRIVALEQPKRVTLVKIDVEGHELRVLMGAAGTLTRYRPALFIEIRSKSSYAGVTAFLEPFGYRQVGSVFQDATVFEFTVGG